MHCVSKSYFWLTKNNVCVFLDEPNNRPSVSDYSGEDCLTLMYGPNELNDVHCTWKSKGYVCEKDSKLKNQYLIYVYVQ